MAKFTENELNLIIDRLIELLCEENNQVSKISEMNEITMNMEEEEYKQINEILKMNKIPTNISNIQYKQSNNNSLGIHSPYEFILDLPQCKHCTFFSVR